MMEEELMWEDAKAGNINEVCASGGMCLGWTGKDLKEQQTGCYGNRCLNYTHFPLDASLM